MEIHPNSGRVLVMRLWGNAVTWCSSSWLNASKISVLSLTVPINDNSTFQFILYLPSLAHKAGIAVLLFSLSDYVAPLKKVCTRSPSLIYRHQRVCAQTRASLWHHNWHPLQLFSDLLVIMVVCLGSFWRLKLTFSQQSLGCIHAKCCVIPRWSHYDHGQISWGNFCS